MSAINTHHKTLSTFSAERGGGIPSVSVNFTQSQSPESRRVVMENGQITDKKIGAMRKRLCCCCRQPKSEVEGIDSFKKSLEVEFGSFAMRAACSHCKVDFDQLKEQRICLNLRQAHALKAFAKKIYEKSFKLIKDTDHLYFYVMTNPRLSDPLLDKSSIYTSPLSDFTSTKLQDRIRSIPTTRRISDDEMAQILESIQKRMHANYHEKISAREVDSYIAQELIAHGIEVTKPAIYDILSVSMRQLLVEKSFFDLSGDELCQLLKTIDTHQRKDKDSACVFVEQRKEAALRKEKAEKLSKVAVEAKKARPLSPAAQARKERSERVLQEVLARYSVSDGETSDSPSIITPTVSDPIRSTPSIGSRLTREIELPGTVNT